jgi:hypothetical protein
VAVIEKTVRHPIRLAVQALWQPQVAEPFGMTPTPTARARATQEQEMSDEAMKERVVDYIPIRWMTRAEFRAIYGEHHATQIGRSE